MRDAAAASHRRSGYFKKRQRRTAVVRKCANFSRTDPEDHLWTHWPRAPAAAQPSRAIQIRGKLHAPISRFRRALGWLFREPVRLHALLEKWTDGIDTIGAGAP